MHERRRVTRVREQPHLGRPEPLARLRRARCPPSRPRPRDGCDGPSVAASKSCTISSCDSAFSIGTTCRLRRGSARRWRSAPPRRRRRSASGRCPIMARPTIFSSAGRSGVASATSAARTANPSMPTGGELRQGLVGDHVLGRHASVAPRSAGAAAGTSGEIGDSTRSRASSTEISLQRSRDRGRGELGHGRSLPARRVADAALRRASCAGRSRASQAAELAGRGRRVRSRTRPWPSGSRACCPRRSGRGRTCRRRPPGPGPAG